MGGWEKVARQTIFSVSTTSETSSGETQEAESDKARKQRRRAGTLFTGQSGHRPPCSIQALTRKICRCRYE